MVNKLLLTGAGVLLVSASMNAAHAADIVDPGVYDWTGPFIGLQGGYAWGNNDTSTENSENGPPVFVFEEDSGSLDLDGFVGGLHVGHNWQSGSLVLGIIGDIEFADMKGDTEVSINDFPLSDLDGEIDWLGSLRLRAGFAADRALLYATGGLAVGGAELSIDNNLSDTSADNQETKWGWTIGGGVEYAVTDELSAFLEYRYTDLGKIDVKLDLPQGQRESEADLDFHAIRAGLSWHFNGL
jgi:outer membrane immunogenic protein